MGVFFKRVSVCSRAASSPPSISGIITSRKIRSGLNSRAAFTASSS